MSQLRLRAIALLCCLLALGGGFVVHGGVDPDPSMNHFPGNEDLAENPDRYVGETVVLGGDATSIDPVVLTGSAGVDEELSVRLVGLEADVQPGDSLWLAGTVRPDGSVTVDAAIVRAPWEITYMLVVSFLGGLWVLGRFVRDWRIDRTAVGFVPAADRDRDGDLDG